MMYQAVTAMCAILPCYYISPQQPEVLNYQVSPSFVQVDAEPPMGDQPFVERNWGDEEYPIVQTEGGFLKGYTMQAIGNRSIKAFTSIPFAKPPVQELRFEPPQKHEGWEGTRDAMSDAPTCIQTDFIEQYKIQGQEDCLHLNVYSPQLSPKEPLPVMVFIHGGGWFFSTSSLYGPSYLLQNEDVVLVTINYRLSMFGFLSTGDEALPGNNGLKDQTLALEWVKNNIAAFGGDNGRVTIFGESAGAGSVHMHMFSPLSRGLFHGAISQSGCATCFWSFTEKAPEYARKYAGLFNCTGSSQDIKECLREKDATSLVAGQLAFLEWTIYPVVVFGPVVEPPHAGAFLSELPTDIYKRGGVAPVPWISGFNHDEGAINIATLLISNDTVPQLNSNWDTYGPIFLDLKNNEDTSVELSNKIRTYYLGPNQQISYEKRHEAVEMFGDRYVMACGIKGIQLHSRYSSHPVYSYRLSFKGKYSIVQLLGQQSKDWGISHLDDLIYLFNNTAYYPTLKLDDEEYKMSQIITSTWASFAATGKPILPKTEPTTSELRCNTWDPVKDDVRMLDLTLTPKMIQDPFYERVKFWSKLGLQDL